MNYTGLNFHSVHSSLNGTHAFPISTLDIARASVTVGYGGGYAPYNPMWLWPFHLAHFTLPFILLEPIADPSLMRPFLSLAPRSIRRYVAERLAMAVTKVWADKFVHIPWLAEVEFLDALGIIQFDKTSGERPDLAGQDEHQTWYVLEAKGRPNSISIVRILAKAKRQAGRVQTINGAVPGLTLGSVLHSQGNGLHLTLDDPTTDNENGINAKIREELFYVAYYQGSRAILASSETETREFSGRKYKTTKISGGSYRVSFGLLDVISQDVMKGVDLLRSEPIEIVDDGTHSIGRDGTALFID